MDRVSVAGMLRTESQALARAVTAAIYAENPALLERYGERGRARCVEDVQYTIDHLVPAIELQAPALFTDYVQWLDELLRARSIDSTEVARSLRLLDREIVARVGAEQGAPVTAILRTAMAALARGVAA